MVVRIVTIVLLLCVGACQSAAVRHNTLPEKFLGTWHCYSHSCDLYRYAYFFRANGKYDKVYKKNNIVRHGEYKILYAVSGDTYILLTRLHLPDENTTVYDYQKLELFNSPGMDIHMRIRSAPSIHSDYLNESGWNNVNIQDHTNFVKNKIDTHTGMMKDGEFSTLEAYSRTN